MKTVTQNHRAIRSQCNPLLALDDDALEDVMAAVSLWCCRNSVAIGSREGQEAIRLAASHRDNSKVTLEQIVKFLVDQLRS
jgi:hypothetical protein